jgi:hypothetical protein
MTQIDSKEIPHILLTRSNFDFRLLTLIAIYI